MKFLKYIILAVFVGLAASSAHAQFVIGKGGDLADYSGPVLIKSPTEGIGYKTGAGGTVTQITSRSTGVTLSKITGKIQTHTTSLAAGASASFTVTNTTVAIGDVVVVAIRSGQTNKETSVAVTAVAAGSFEVTVFNRHASTAEVGAIVINFAVIKAVTS
jgi:hypothetical protein